MKNVLRMIACLSVFCAGLSVSADEYDTTTLFRKGAWIVELTHNTNTGTLWCAAETTNRSGQTFSVTAYDGGYMTLFIFDSRWSLSDRPVRFLLDIDYSRWTIDGSARDISISVQMDDTETAARFLRQLQSGSAVALYNESERRLATFSLSGSYAAVLSLFECWNQITVPSDPFTTSTDPF